VRTGGGAWRYRADPVPVPEGGLRWEDEGASWELTSGKIWTGEPDSDGRITAWAFEGQGRFRMAVPDPVELAQLRRFTRKPDLASIDEPFSSLVVRTTGELPDALANLPKASDYAVLPLARERQEGWLTQRFEDVDARVLAGLLTPGDRYVRADVRTAGFGWLTWEYDARRLEEIRLETYNAPFDALEVWLALDRAAERDARGRPASRVRPGALDLVHADLAVDLSRAGRDKDRWGGRFRADLRLRGGVPGARAIQLFLDPMAKVTDVREGDHPLTFVRDHVGARRSILDDRLYDDSLLILLDEPLAAGAERRIEIDYELETGNYVASHFWYPDTEDDETFLTDPHTGRLEITTRRKFETRSMGRKVEEKEGPDGTVTTVWEIDRPTKMLTFTFAEKVHEERASVAGAPEVACFGSMIEVSRRKRFAEVGHDVAESLAFFGDLLDAPLASTPGEPFYVTSIQAAHGQSFDGFLELGEQSFDILGPGVAELFHAHETAHQWWGHRVGAATYRDAWLGEAFAEYSAMMFVEKKVADGPRFYQEILRSYHDELTGSIKSGFSKFSRMDVNLRNRAHSDRIGPIGLGWRANTGELPSAYSSLVYAKGAVVLHMLRRMIGDEAFVGALRDFLHAHDGGTASTADFAAAVAGRVPGDWSWFFDEWVDRSEIPTYRWSADIASAPAADGTWPVRLRVAQTDVPAGFRMPVPVRADLDGGTAEERTVLVDKPEETFELRFSRRPRSVTFDPDDAVLAQVRDR
jgi:hypothetical protein